MSDEMSVHRSRKSAAQEQPPQEVAKQPEVAKVQTAEVAKPTPYLHKRSEIDYTSRWRVAGIAAAVGAFPSLFVAGCTASVAAAEVKHDSPANAAGVMVFILGILLSTAIGYVLQMEDTILHEVRSRE